MVIIGRYPSPKNHGSEKKMGISPIVVSFQTLRHFPLNHDGVGEGVSTIIPPENSEDNMSNHILVGQFPLFFVEKKKKMDPNLWNSS